MDNETEMKIAEEARRDRNTDPLERWNAILQTIEFAEAQQPLRRNSKKSCLERQAALNRPRFPNP